MQVAVICVNYGSNTLAVKYLESLAKASSRISGQGELQVALVDNTPFSAEQDAFLNTISAYPFVDAFSSEGNLGYFGGVRAGVDRLGILKDPYPDWLIVSNVDVEVDLKFMEVLLSKNRAVGALAPAIISRRSGRDRNPKLLRPITVSKARVQRFIFSTYLFQNLYIQLALLKSFLSRSQSSESTAREIYAPHGSFMVFSSTFLSNGGNFDHPCFLFGEEIFIGQLLQKLRLPAVYDPELRVYDFDHASTGQWRSRQICRYAGESAKHSYETICQEWESQRDHGKLIC